MTDPYTLAAVCTACGGAVTLQMTHWPATKDEHPPPATQAWACPYCLAKNDGEYPGQLVWVRRGHGTPPAGEQGAAYERDLDRFLDDMDYRAEIARTRDQDTEFQADLATLGLTTDDRLIAWLRAVRPTARFVDPESTPEQFVRDFVREVVKQKARKS